MPKKLFKRFAPKAAEIRDHPSLRFLRPFLNNPNLFHLNRYSVSMAFLIGLFLAFIPLPGQMVVAAIMALWVRCNLPITVALVWVTNPITMAPILFFTYELGRWLLDTPPIPDALEQLSWETLGAIWKPLVVGSLCTGIFLSILSYIFIRCMWRFHVIFQWRRRQKKRLLKKIAQS
jgi:uncharacterized protein